MIPELAPAEIEELLRAESVARLACSADGELYVVPISYAYDGSSLIVHSVPGRKIEMMRRNPEVCLEVDRVAGPAEWRSVIAWGRFEELQGDEARHAMELLIDRFRELPWAESPAESGPADPRHRGIDSGLAGGTIGHPGIVFRIRLGTRTGRGMQR